MPQKLLYPIGLQTFSKIRESGFLYVDKTEYIHHLVNSGQYYFLSRPRRFGKSLLLSTIDCFFSGRRDLFDGLAISRYEYDWDPNPVLHLDFTAKDYKEEVSLDEKLNSLFEPWEKIYG
ncbi:AAA family ATPase, partial [Bacteroides caecimuris]|uniref:AAA family ATPase n=1 Tax=Bacteroides caecimuris TaxID=1796613 RepID=UPI0026585F58